MRISAYDVEPKEGGPVLPSWADSFPLDFVPFPSDELRFDDHFWMVVRRSIHAHPDGVHPIKLGVRFVQ